MVMALKLCKKSAAEVCQNKVSSRLDFWQRLPLSVVIENDMDTFTKLLLYKSSSWPLLENALFFLWALGDLPTAHADVAARTTFLLKFPSRFFHLHARQSVSPGVHTPSMESQAGTEDTGVAEVAEDDPGA